MSLLRTGKWGISQPGTSLRGRRGTMVYFQLLPLVCGIPPPGGEVGTNPAGPPSYIEDLFSPGRSLNWIKIKMVLVNCFIPLCFSI